jgi:hypothetical protein
MLSDFKRYVDPMGFVLWAVFTTILLIGGCSVTSMDASTSKALDACKEIENEFTRADCIVRVAETDPDK